MCRRNKNSMLIFIGQRQSNICLLSTYVMICGCFNFIYFSVLIISLLIYFTLLDLAMSVHSFALVYFSYSCIPSFILFLLGFCFRLINIVLSSFLRVPVVYFLLSATLFWCEMWAVFLYPRYLCWSIMCLCHCCTVQIKIESDNKWKINPK